MNIPNFQYNDLAYDVWNDKYRHNNEDIKTFFNTIITKFAKKAGKFESLMFKDELSDYGKQYVNMSEEEIIDLFTVLFNNFKYIIPQGSVLAGLGNEQPVSLSNCFVLDTKDSIEDIFNTGRDTAQIYKRRGGNGIDLSVLRPSKAIVNNSAKTTGGVIPFMELYSTITHTIGQEGRRKIKNK